MEKYELDPQNTASCPEERHLSRETRGQFKNHYTCRSFFPIDNLPLHSTGLLQRDLVDLEWTTQVGIFVPTGEDEETAQTSVRLTMLSGTAQRYVRTALVSWLQRCAGRSLNKCISPRRRRQDKYRKHPQPWFGSVSIHVLDSIGKYKFWLIIHSYFNVVRLPQEKLGLSFPGQLYRCLCSDVHNSPDVMISQLKQGEEWTFCIDLKDLDMTSPSFYTVPGENCTCLLQVRTQAKLS